MPSRPSTPEPERISLAPVNPDPVASMRMWGATVRLGNRNFSIPAMDAAGWLEILLAENIIFEDVFPGLAGSEAVFDVNMMLLAGTVTAEELEHTILDVIEEASGRAWWITIRLCHTLRVHWETVGGELARHGVVPFGVPLSYWLDAAYATAVSLLLQGPKPKRAEEWTRALTTPPVSEGRNVDEEANSLAFLAAMRGSR